MREVAGPTLLGFLTYTFFLMLRVVFSLSEQIFVKGLSGMDALRILGASLPHVVVLTVPMSFLFGVLIALGRMNSDNEVIALQAGGVALRRILRPVLILALVLTAANASLTIWLLPEANRSLRELKMRLLQEGTTLGQIEPRVFYDEFPNVLLYVKDIDRASGYWKGVLLFDRSVPGQDRLVLAQRGRLVAAGATGSETTGSGPLSPTGPAPATSSPGADEQHSDGGSPWLLLEDVVTHQFDPRKPESYKRDRNRVQLLKLFSSTRNQRMTISLGEREQDTWELWRRSREVRGEGWKGDSRQARRVRLATVELHKRLAIPVACLAFALLGLPLGIGSRASTRGRGFVLSVTVIMFYYVLLNHGEVLAREGRIPPWLGPWIPNLVLAVAAYPLLMRMGRWLGERRRGTGVLAGIVSLARHALRALAGALRPRAAGTGGPRETTGKIPVALHGGRRVLRFPAMLDRYVLLRLVTPLLGVLATTVGLYIIVDLGDKIDEIAKHHATFGIFVAYYLNFVPQVVLDVGPLAMLIAVLVLLTLLERRLELTVLKASGISVFRVAVSIVLLAAVVAGLLFALEEMVVPTSNRKARHYLSIIKGRETSHTGYAAPDRQWIFSRDGLALYNYLRFDPGRKEIIGLTEYRFAPGSFRLASVTYSDRVAWRQASWIAMHGWIRRIHPDGSDDFRWIEHPVELGITESPHYFAQEYRSPSELDLVQLRAYIRRLQDSGYRPTHLMVRWQQKITYPLSALVMVLLGLPYGLNRGGGRKATPMVGVGLAIVLGVVYFVVVAILGKMGEAGILPPVVAAWAPVAMALLYSVNRLTTVRT